MPRPRSSVGRLPEAVVAAVDAAIADGVSTDELVGIIAARGHAVSRSAAGRYAQANYEEIVARVRHQREVVDKLAAEVGGSEAERRLVTHLSGSVLMRHLLEYQADDITLDPKSLNQLTGAARNHQAASKLEVETAIRRRTLDEAAAAAGAAARKAGATPETADFIRRQVLGLAQPGAPA